jgi:hypothetical protein
MLIIIIIFILLLTCYCILEKRKLFYPATSLKVILSAYIAVISLYAAIQMSNFVFYIFALGLVFAVPADFFLQYIKSDLKLYRIGIFFFGAMHVCLLISFYLLWSITIYEFIIWFIFLAILLIFQKIQKWRMGKEKRQLTIYTVLVTFMAAKAVSLLIVEPSSFTLAVSLGGLFFFISDIFLGIWDYYEEKFVFLVINRIVYFVGQLSLAFYLLLK